MGSSKVRKLNGGATGRLGHGREGGGEGVTPEPKTERDCGDRGTRWPAAPRPRGP